MSEENKDLGDKAKDSLKGAKGKAKDLGKKAEKAFEETKESAKDFAKEGKEAAKDFESEAKKTADEFAEGLKGAGGENKKLLAGLLALLLGYLGIHKFILGYTKEGIIQIVASVVTCGIAGIIPFIEGIIYLTKTDEDFYNTYQVGRKPWF
ncbi:TM2 domain-containing membrane protein YozV [Arenibacter nanhaiticus]|uniref:TM2 domain-containing membrane protein YozV n=1 Tax=Arenibacter nanhaiticus TaxID=558155 RepID=A0A1M6KCW7_9FLAO|nr:MULTISPECIES: TM2 domain-containing protein [Arenibacter]NKI25359.1 NINE protein [Arenibacter sp. 6A1]SHJ56803.1 TM2 domain-containing membrane protein YozV [Arenibacter nanhaiticus]